MIFFQIFLTGPSSVSVLSHRVLLGIRAPLQWFSLHRTSMHLNESTHKHTVIRTHASGQGTHQLEWVQSSHHHFPLSFFLPQCTVVAQYGLSAPLSALNLEHLCKSLLYKHVSKNKSQILSAYWEWILFYIKEGRCEVRGVFWGAKIGRMKLRPSDCVCLLVSVLLCTSAVRCPGDESCCARQGATFTLCCQMSSQEDVGHNTHTHSHPPTAVFDFKSYSQFTSLCTTVMCM